MNELHYTLTEKEIIHYYEFVTKNNEITAKEQILVKSWIPGFAVILLLFLKAPILYWIVALVVSIAWIFFVAPIVFDNITATAAKRKFKNDQINLPTIDVAVDEEKLIYNGKAKKVLGYGSYLDLFIIITEENENLIVPESAFQSDKHKMEDFIRKTMLIAGK